MRFLVVGLGSMGKRRIRCLNVLGHNEIFGVDCRDDRRLETEAKYNIKTFDNVLNALEQCKPDAFIISVPPDIHHLIIKIAIENNLPFFVEACCEFYL